MTHKLRMKPFPSCYIWQNLLTMLLALLLICPACDSHSHTPQEDRGDWINPSDMINYDSSSKTMTKTTDTSKSSDIDDTQNCDCEKILQPYLQREKDAVQKLQKCEKHLQESLEEQPVSHIPFFRQFTKYFIKKINAGIDMHEISHYNAHIELSGADLATLNRFAYTENEQPQSANEILTRMITDITYLENYQAPTLNDMIGEFFGGCQNIIMLSLCIVIVVWLCTTTVKIHLNYGYSYLSIFLVFVMFMFVISVPWNWWHLYKKKVAERQSSNIMEVPEECLGGKKTTSQTLFDAFKSAFTFRQDVCVKYHESLLIDPIWEVPPTKAIAVTITKFFLEPLEHIGQSLSLLIRNMLQDLPLHVWPIALLTLFIFVLLVMTMTAGYRINFMHLIQVGPGQQQPQAIAPSAETNRVQELTTEVTNLQNRLEAAEKEKTELVALAEECGPTEDRAALCGPSSLLSITSAKKTEASEKLMASGDSKNQDKPSPVEAVVKPSGDFERKESEDISAWDNKSPAEISIASQEASTFITEISETPLIAQEKVEDEPESITRTEVAKLASDYNESGTDSDIEIISQDDMTKL